MTVSARLKDPYGTHKFMDASNARTKNHILMSRFMPVLNARKILNMILRGQFVVQHVRMVKTTILKQENVKVSLWVQQEYHRRIAHQKNLFGTPNRCPARNAQQKLLYSIKISVSVSNVQDHLTMIHQ